MAGLNGNGKLVDPNLPKKIVDLEAGLLHHVDALVKMYQELHDGLAPQERYARMLVARLQRIWAGVARGMRDGRLSLESVRAAGEIQAKLRRQMVSLGIKT